MHVRPLTLAAAALAASVAGCASDGSLTTAAINEQPKVAAAKPAVDPQCVALAAQIEQLRAEGSVGRLEQAASGKTSTVQVKRASIGKQAELNKAHMDYQAKCSPIAPKPATAAAPAPAPAPAAKPAVKPAAKTAALATAPAAAKPPVNVVKTVAKAAAAEAAPAAAAPVPAPAAPVAAAAPSVVTTTVPPAAQQ